MSDLKRQARTALHGAMSEPASYVGPDEDSEAVPSPVQISAGLVLTVRWHNKLARNGALDGGFTAEIIEGIDRLVFNQDQLTALGLTLEHRGLVDIPGYNIRFELDAKEPGDGPLNVYWTVVKQ